MKMSPSLTRTALLVSVGASLCGAAAYMVYLLLRNDDDDTLYISTVSKKKANSKLIEMKVPHEYVGALIGHNGANIKDIQAKTNARINFRDSDKNKKEDRICVIRGTPEECVLAESMIMNFISSDLKVTTTELKVPSYCVGRIIGRNGDRINMLTSSSGAKIKVNKPNDGSSQDGIILIQGNSEQISTVKAYLENIVSEEVEKRRLLDADLAKREPRGRPRAPAVLAEPQVQKERLPSPGSGEMEVYVSAVVDPSKFWVQRVGPDASELDHLVEQMTEYYCVEENRAQHRLVRGVQAGDMVAAPFSYDKKWYRAEVVAVSEADAMAELCFVDYGDSEQLPVAELLQLRTDFLRLRFQAIECFLAGVRPVEAAWTNEATDFFEDLAQVALWKKMSAKVRMYRERREGSPVPGVDLFRVRQGRDVDVAAELVSNGHAVFSARTSPASPSNGV